MLHVLNMALRIDSESIIFIIAFINFDSHLKKECM